MAKEKPKKEKGTKGIWKNYTIKGDKIERKNKTCPKCGQDYQMATHKDRTYCGKCGYTEFKKKEQPKEEKK